MATEIASAYVALIARMPDVKKTIEEALGASPVQKATQAQGKSLGGLLSGAIGGAVALGLSATVKKVTDSIGAAVSRVDTINNFPKVMANLGYSADDAAASIKTMSSRLTGLPTALDSMAGMVQQLAPLTGGLAEATDLSLALNNALLAGGKSTEMQANAMEQYTQMLAVGKVDMAAWRSMVSAMPGQMDQLAASILGAGHKSMDLYAAMKDGTVGFDEFNAAVLRLNDEGTGAFASFEQQARSATDGIATGQANLETSITRGLASLIERFQPQIVGLLASTRDAVDGAFKAVGGFVDWVGANREWLAPLAVSIGTVVGAIAAWTLVSKGWLAVQAIVAGVQTAYIAATYGMTAASYGYQGASKIATAAQWAFNAAMSANPIMLVVLAIAALVAGLIYFFTQTELGQQIWENVTNAIGTAVTWLWESVIKPVIDFIGAAWDWLYTNIIEPIVLGIMLYIGLWAAIFEWLWNTILAPIFEAIGAVFEWIWANVIQPIIDYIVAGVEAWGQIFEWLHQNVIKPVFDAIATAFDWVWTYGIKPVIDAITGAVEWVGKTIRDVFGGISDFIGSAFQAVLGVVRGPINALIDLINGIIGGLNDIRVDIPDWVPMVGGQTFGLNIPKIPRLAEGAFVTARPGGVLANVGEGQYDEVVQPTDGPKFDQFVDKLASRVGGAGLSRADMDYLISGLADAVESRTRLMLRQGVTA